MTRYGGDCYLFAALALGFVDLIIEAGFHAWDAAALIPLVEGAGGIITGWDGGSAPPAKPFWRRATCACTQQAMKLARRLTRRYPRNMAGKRRVPKFSAIRPLCLPHFRPCCAVAATLHASARFLSEPFK